MMKAILGAAIGLVLLVTLAFAWSGRSASAGGTDTDGDGCPDASEGGPFAYQGGQRDYLNPWDYFNPSHDGMNRVDDIILVAWTYGLDSTDMGYTTNTDRSFIGPNEWNLGAPDGRVRADDVLAVVDQYFHDCS